MSKYHTISLGDKEFIVRDVPVVPFKKKLRVAPIELKNEIIEHLNRNENIELLKYINNRIHFYLYDKGLIDHLDDEDMAEYIQKNVFNLKNDLIV